MKTAAYIFARGGSKGLPGKNLRLLDGKPLIAWSIEHALSVKRIDDVIVSTDSYEIADIAIKYGAIVPFNRPAELAEDDSPEWLAWQHALINAKTLGDYNTDVMVSVPATAPLRLPIDIDNCLDEYEKGSADVIITVTESHRNPYFNMVQLSSQGEATIAVSPKESFNRRQDAPKLYDMTTVCYVANSKFVLENNSMFQGRVRAVEVPKERALDIDTLLDFQIAEHLMSKRNQLRK